MPTTKRHKLQLQGARETKRSRSLQSPAVPGTVYASGTVSDSASELPSAAGEGGELDQPAQSVQIVEVQVAGISDLTAKTGVQEAGSDEELQGRWPRIPCADKERLLHEAVKELERLLHSKRRAPLGHTQKWHEQVLAFMNVQIMDLEGSRIQLSLEVARHSRKGGHVARRIRWQETSWMTFRMIPVSRQGKHPKLHCMLEDPGTCAAMDEYIVSAGRLANAVGLANAVTEYWHSIDKDGADGEEREERELAAQTAQEWFHRKGYKWKQIRKGVYKDGHERADVKEYKNTVFLPYLAELQHTFVEWLFPNPNGPPVLKYPTNLPPGVKPRIQVTHDECSFNSKDGVQKPGCKETMFPSMIKAVEAV
ncbi:hypothetical protein BDD12DRAFT_905452 [Trichophaea hybrida]|nr:hypothetical protein BDD12DRAFT_905452 [Trichophaea hybrida]